MIDMDSHMELADNGADPEPPAPPTVCLPADQAQQIVDYLANQPYRHVAHLITYLLEAANQ